MNPRLGSRDAAPREPFELVANREVEVLYRVANRLTLNKADAEDLVGQALLSAYRAWEQFDGRHARSWLITILRNEWRQKVRRGASHPEMGLEEISEPCEEDFWKAVEVHLDAATILEALDRLPEEYRLPIALCDVEEMEYAEAAEALGLPLATLRTRLFRGRKKLQAQLVSLGHA